MVVVVVVVCVCGRGEGHVRERWHDIMSYLGSIYMWLRLSGVGNGSHDVERNRSCLKLYSCTAPGAASTDLSQVLLVILWLAGPDDGACAIYSLPSPNPKVSQCRPLPRSLVLAMALLPSAACLALNPKCLATLLWP